MENREKIRELVIKAIADSNQLTSVVDEICNLQAGKVTESIWSNKNYVIAMAEVSHIVGLPEKYEYLKCPIHIVFKYSKWNNDTQDFEPNVYLSNEESVSFKKDWCIYRSELESHTLINPKD